MDTDGIEYLLPEGVGLDSARTALSARLELAIGARRLSDRTFYDTFDGRLHARGLALVHVDGRLALLEGAACVERQAIGQPGAVPRMLATELPDGRLRDLLVPIIEIRALTPIARTRSRRQTLHVLNSDAKTVAWLVLEVPTLVLSGRARARLRPRLRVAPVRGYDGALRRLRRTLEEELGFVVSSEPLQDEAVKAGGGTPGGTSSKLELALRPEQRADGAATALLVQLLATIEQNMSGTLAQVDTEFLHDLRVAVRRTRSAQRQLRRAFSPGPLTRFRSEFRWLQQVTGPARDLDVYVLEFDGFSSALPQALRADLQPLHDLLLERRRREQRRMKRALRSARVTALLTDWSAFLAGVVHAPQFDRPDAGRRIITVASERIDTVYRRVVKAGKAVDGASPPVALHELRKSGKELRYLLEFFARLYPSKVVKPMIRTLKALQDTLGRFQDREVQATMLRSLRDELAALDRGPAALMAMDVLIEHLQDEQKIARSEFAERFDAFAAEHQQALVRKTFR